jgi:hypothetical protein
MTTHSEPLRSLLKKKRVLLVDTSSTKRELRAEVMRRFGVEGTVLPISAKRGPGGELTCTIWFSSTWKMSCGVAISFVKTCAAPRHPSNLRFW